METTCENTCLTEDRLIKLIKSIFIKESEDQQQDILNIISGKFDIQMKEIREFKRMLVYLKQILAEEVKKSKNERALCVIR